MTLNPYRLIWRADPVRLTLPAPANVDLGPLRAALPRWSWSGAFITGCRGRVRGNRVTLRYQRAFRHNDTSAVLDACLVTGNGVHYLEGVYRMAQFGRVFMTLWFSLLLMLLPLFGLASLSDLFRGTIAGLAFAVGPVLMLGFGLALLHLGQAGWAMDKRHIETFILTHLTQAADDAT